MFVKIIKKVVLFLKISTFLLLSRPFGVIVCSVVSLTVIHGFQNGGTTLNLENSEHKRKIIINIRRISFH